MTQRMVKGLVGAILALTAVDAARADYRSGAIVYTPATDFVTGFTPNGTGYFVSQAYVPNPPQPVVGQPYYISIYMSGIASPAAGRLMAVNFVPPAGTSVYVNSQSPVRCFYRAMDGTGNQIEFTNTVITDQSFGASLRIFGCPQPTSAANPFPIVQLPGGQGTAYQFDRRDPQRQGQTVWPMGSYAAYEFLIPVVSNRVMDGISSNNRLYGAIQSIQGDGVDPWAYPFIPLLVSPASGGGDVADMSAAPPAVPAPPPSGKAGVEVVCTNLGPNSAQSANCGFTGIPAGVNATVTCTPSSLPTTLAVNGTIRCALITDRFVGSVTVNGVASSSTADSNSANNTRALTLTGGLSSGGDVVLANGFE